MDIAELIARVEAATGSDAVLDEAIYRAIDPQRALEIPLAPRLTESIDAALALKNRLLPGQAAAVGDMAFTNHPRGPWATVWTLDGSPKWTAEAATPALAIILALLRSISDRSS